MKHIKILALVVVRSKTYHHGTQSLHPVKQVQLLFMHHKGTLQNELHSLRVNPLQRPQNTGGNFKYGSNTRPKDKKSIGNSRAGGDPASQICFNFNRNVTSACELPNNLCRNHRQHKCLTSQQWGCKQLNHFPQPVPAAQKFNQAGRSQAHVIVPPAQSPDLSVAGEMKQMLTDIKSELHSDMQSLTARIGKLEALPHSASASQNASPQDIFSQALTFGNPAITAVPSNLQVSDLDLANKNILWTRVTSAGIPLPLPLDSCCSLSLVSQAHAEVICKTHHTMQFTKLYLPFCLFLWQIPMPSLRPSVLYRFPLFGKMVVLLFFQCL